MDIVLSLIRDYYMKRSGVLKREQNGQTGTARGTNFQ
jgi:hypothetical protein